MTERPDERWERRERERAERDSRDAAIEAARTPEERMASLRLPAVFTADDGELAIRMAADKDVKWAVAHIEELEAERDRAKAYEPCDPCKAEDHANCTGYCTSMCCALASCEEGLVAAEAREQKLREALEPLVIAGGDGLTPLDFVIGYLTDYGVRGAEQLRNLRAALDATVVAPAEPEEKR